MLLPLVGHATQSERFEQQVNASEPTKKRLWAQIVRAKITAQGRHLASVRGKDHGLFAMAKRVRSGDPDNLEAQATRKYWPVLFGKDFRRDREAEDQNRLLNYGYAVLRATVARAIAAAGLHPTIGIHHHNRYDAYCLADDLMEPFRPMVDAAALMWTEMRGVDAPLDKEAKAAMLAALTCRVTFDNESRTLFDASARLASSCALVFAGERDELSLPEAFDAPARPKTV
jgi:CRISPR-associated protein Cas1